MFIRADGNCSIGIGHIMRCLSIANALRRRGEESIFILADNAMKKTIQAQGYKTIILNSSWKNLDFEIELLNKNLSYQREQLLLLDSYFVTIKYMSELQRNVKLVYIDDINSFIYPCDILVNYNLYAEEMYKENNYKNTSLFLGPKYFPLREEFASLPPYELREDVRSIVITTGGTDEKGFSLSIVKAIKNCSLFDDVRVSVIVGEFNKHLGNIMSEASQTENIIVLTNVKNIAYYFNMADIVISAGGTTAYELLSIGVPTILYSMADNQEQLVKAFYSHRFADYAGDIREDKEGVINNILSLLSNYITGKKKRAIKSSMALKEDIKVGADNVAKLLINAISK